MNYLTHVSRFAVRFSLFAVRLPPFVFRLSLFSFRFFSFFAFRFSPFAFRGWRSGLAPQTGVWQLRRSYTPRLWMLGSTLKFCVGHPQTVTCFILPQKASRGNTHTRSIAIATYMFAQITTWIVVWCHLHVSRACDPIHAKPCKVRVHITNCCFRNAYACVALCDWIAI